MTENILCGCRKFGNTVDWAKGVRVWHWKEDRVQGLDRCDGSYLRHVDSFAAGEAYWGKPVEVDMPTRMIFQTGADGAGKLPKAPASWQWFERFPTHPSDILIHLDELSRP